MIADNATTLALIVGVAAMILTLFKQPNVIMPTNRDLHRELKELRATVNTLRRMVDEKDEQIRALSVSLRAAEQRIEQLEQAEKERTLDQTTLLAVIDDGAGFDLDIARLRRAFRDTGVEINRLTPNTMAKLEERMNMRRIAGCPVRYVHFGLHAGPEGLQFEDGLATGVWLSNVLYDAKVALIAGCRGDTVGDLIGVVPFVVSISNDVTHQNASLFALAFWCAIGERLSPADAYQRARQRMPAVAEYTDLHR